MAEPFVHLHNHSFFSLLDGLSSIKGMVKCASDMGYESLAITDHGSCAGLLQFQNACKDLEKETGKKMKPILGMEAYSAADYTNKDKKEQHHLILLAKNVAGYRNLIKLSSLSFLNGFYYKPRIDFKLLEAHKEGLIVSSACSGGEIPSLLLDGKEKEAEALANKFKEVFKDDFYLEIMLHKYFTDKERESLEKRLANTIYKMGRKLGIKVIATQDSHYTHKNDWEAHDVLLAVQTIQSVKNPNRMTFGSDDFYIKPYEQMAHVFKGAPDTLSNTVEISEKIENKLIIPSMDLLPKFTLPEGFKTEEDYLKALVITGMKQKGFTSDPVYRERIKMEMNVIIKCGYTKYFLILWDIVNFARTQGIAVGCGRGSCVSSLCLYVLDITKGIDPIKYGLIFERFLNPERISPPDVDMDFDYFRRDEVYNYIVQKYGADYCSRIGTYNKLKARATIKGCAKALDLGNDWQIYQDKLAKHPNTKVEMTKNSLNIADSLSKQVPFDPKINIELALKEKEFCASMQRYPKLLEVARKIEGTVSAGGVHPAGILICKDPVIEHIPLRNAKGGVICSQYDGGEVEKMGLLKFDLLALKTLTVIDRTVKMIKEKYPDKISKDFDIDKLDPNDKDVFKILNGTHPTANTLGVFQFESKGITELLAKIHVDKFEDMIVANALYRPGPLGAGMHDMYCSYKHKQKEIQYLHPKMGEILSETYGIMVYQENIMKLAQGLAGFTGGQADSLRKAIGKKDKVLMEEARNRFSEGCVKNGVDLDIAKKIFEQIEFFGDYGFNKCLSGDTKVLNKADGSKFTLKELEGIFSKSNSDCRYVDLPIVLDSYVDGEIVEDEVLDVFETGEKEIYEIELDNGMIIKCTLDHKFYCSDDKPHTVKEIMEKEFEIIYEESYNISMSKCRIKSIKSIGKQMTYNVTMKGDQHNYKIVSDSGAGVYSRNSHSAGYALTAFQTAWLKYYYPLEFMCNLLTSEINNTDKNEKLGMYMDAAERMRIGIAPQDINKSGLEFKITTIYKKLTKTYEPGIVKPLTMLNGVGEKAVTSIVASQPYKDLEDFVRRTDGRVVNSRVFNALVEAGCMDCWKVGKDILIRDYPEIKKRVEKEEKQREKQEKYMEKFECGSIFDLPDLTEEIKV